MSNRHNLFCFGVGFSAEAVVAELDRTHWDIAGTSTTREGADHLTSRGISGHVFDGTSPGEGVAEALRAATHVLVSAPPDAAGDPVLAQLRTDLLAAPHLEWIGYLSTIGVYGDRNGAWLDESAVPQPTSARSRYRLAAEDQWRALAAERGCRCVVFRLAGIYGPGRSAVDNVAAGRARRIIKPEQMFNRIHVADIAQTVIASMAGRGKAQVLNVADDEPAPPQDVIAYAADLLDAPLPPAVPYDSPELSAMQRSFFAESKRVRNALLKADLGIRLRYPTYREGLQAIVKDRVV